MGRALDVMQG